jgi:hypothetical protein
VSRGVDCHKELADGMRLIHVLWKNEQVIKKNNLFYYEDLEGVMITKKNNKLIV